MTYSRTTMSEITKTHVNGRLLLITLLLVIINILWTSEWEFPGTPHGQPRGFWQSIFDPHRRIRQPNTDPLRGYLTKHFNPVEFWPQFERIFCIFLAFFIYFLSIPTHSPRVFLTGNSLSVCHSHASVLVHCICMKAHVFGILHPSRGILA